MKVVEKGDHYILEVAATVKSVMEKWTQSVTDGDILGLGKGDTNKHIVAWQSKVGALTDTGEPVQVQVHCESALETATLNMGYSQPEI